MFKLSAFFCSSFWPGQNPVPFGILLVIPAKAGIQFLALQTKTLDPGFRRDDG
jgi:hypothetical protein